MSGEIFISYRREDSAGTTGRLYDRLARAFPPRKIFMDVDAQMHGLDFVKVLDAKVAACDVLLAVIGPGWLTQTEKNGRRRLDNPDDLVRIELASALRREIAVIPVLVDGAAMPSAEALPADLKALSRRGAVELRNTRFNVDSDLVVAAIKRRLGGAGTASSETSDRTPAWLWASLIAVGIVLFSYYFKK